MKTTILTVGIRSTPTYDKGEVDAYLIESTEQNNKLVAHIAELEDALAPLAGFLPIPLGCADSTKLLLTVEAGYLRRARDTLNKKASS